MADGTAYDFEVRAQGIGTAATADEIERLAGALEAAERVATPFDAAIAATQASLANAAAASANAADALAGAESAFTRLERESSRANMALEKARIPPDLAKLEGAANAAAAAVRGQAAAVAEAERAMASATAESMASASESYRNAVSQLLKLEGAAKRSASALERAAVPPNLDALQSQADAAAAAVLEQARAVDEARNAAEQAAAAHQKQADTLNTLQGAAKKSAVSQRTLAGATKSSGAGLRESMMAAQGLSSSFGPLGGRIDRVVQGLGKSGIAGVAVAAAVALAALAVGVVALGVKMVKFAIASSDALKNRLQKATDRWQQSMKKLVSGIDAGKVIGAFEKITRQFDTSTAAGSALKRLIDVLFQPIMRAVEWLGPILAEMWKGAVYGALQFAIVCVRVRNAVLRAIPKEVRKSISDLIGKIDALGLAFSAGEIVFTAVAAAIGVVVGFFALLGAAIVAASWPFVAIINYGKNVIAALTALGPAFSGTLDAIKGWVTGAASAAKDFVMGIVNGIKNGVGAVADAVRGLASSAVGALKSALKIGSPSKLTLQMGGWTSEGLAAGIEGGTGRVKRAVEGMADAGVVGPTESAMAGAVAGAQGGAGGGGGATYQITIHAPSGDGEDIRAAFERWLTSQLEGHALAMGGGEVPA